MLSDFSFIFIWWLTILFLGVFSLPVILILFKNFWDKGYIFSKIASISLLTYLIFVFGFAKILPFTNFSLFILLFVLFLINAFILYKPKNRQYLISVFKEKHKIFIYEEILFFAILTIWSFVRGFSPDIEGLEKFMDWGFINSALRSNFLPPADMWFANEKINYYYFGHLMFAMLTKLSNIPSAITYNLSLATTCALTFVSGFSLSSNLVYAFLDKKKKMLPVIFAGIISAILLTFGGNLHTIYSITKTNIKNNGKLVLSIDAFSKASQSYWYPNATRFIGYDPDTKDKTIHEFPLYSFVVSDLHGHVNDIAVVIFFMAFLFSISLENFTLLNWKLIIPSGFLLSVAYMTNAWDFAVYGLLYAFSVFFINLEKKSLKDAFLITLINGILIIVYWFVFSVPFSAGFTPMAEGLRFSDMRSPFYQLFILYGGFWLICVPFLVFLFSLAIKETKKQINKKNIKYQIPNTKYLTCSDTFTLSLIMVATLMVIIPEIIYIKDIYTFDFRRANTMFKLVYQAFIMYSLISGYIFVRLSKSKLYKTLFAIVFFCHMIYPFFAIKSFYGLKNYKGIWGMNFLQKDFPSNFEAINWINKNIQGQPVMLEAPGDGYTTYNQVSVSTGLPTVVGWVVHEWLWRGSYDKPAKRIEDVNRIYESKDLGEVNILLKKYNVDYVFVGSKEYEKYKDLNEENFQKLGSLIFQSDNTKVYKLNK